MRGCDPKRLIRREIPQSLVTTRTHSPKVSSKCLLVIAGSSQEPLLWQKFHPDFTTLLTRTTESMNGMMVEFSDSISMRGRDSKASMLIADCLLQTTDEETFTFTVLKCLMAMPGGYHCSRRLSPSLTKTTTEFKEVQDMRVSDF